MYNKLTGIVDRTFEQKIVSGYKIFNIGSEKLLKSPIIIMGTGRSGTSVFTRLLGLHPNIWAFKWESQLFSGLPGYGEIVLRKFNSKTVEKFLNNLSGRLFRRTIREGKPNAYDAGLFEILTKDEMEKNIKRFNNSLSEAQNRHMRLRALEEFANNIFGKATLASGAKRWCEKTPRNLLYADIIAEIFPNAKFINVVRDGRDVASSMMDRKFWPIASSTRFQSTKEFTGEITLEKCARYWNTLSIIGREMEKKLGQQKCCTIRFEDVVNQREETFRKVLDFLEEPFDESVLDKDFQVLRQNRAHVDRWKVDLTKEQQQLFEMIAKDQLDYYGY